MASIIDKLRMKTLKGQIEALRLESVALATQFEAAQTNTEKARLARRYDQALKQTHAMQLILELLERKQREAGGAVATE